MNLAFALREVQREIEAWDIARMHEGTPLFSGGLVDSWPAWAVDAIAICRIESMAIRAHLTHREREEAKRHG